MNEQFKGENVPSPEHEGTVGEKARLHKELQETIEEEMENFYY